MTLFEPPGARLIHRDATANNAGFAPDFRSLGVVVGSILGLHASRGVAYQPLEVPGLDRCSGAR